MKFRTEKSLSTAAQLAKKSTPKDLRHESMLQYTANPATTKLTLRAKEQQMKAATLLKDKDYDLACSAAYKGQCEAAIIWNLSPSCFQLHQVNCSSWNSPCYKSASGWIVLF